MLRFVRAKMLDHVDECAELIELHRAELVKSDTLKRSKQLDLHRYANLQGMNILITVLAYHEQTIVGYSVGVIFPHPHHVDVWMLSNDSLYLHPEHRRGRNGLGLIAETEAAARDAGCALVLWNAEPDTELEKLLPRIGYGVMNTVMMKEL